LGCTLLEYLAPRDGRLISVDERANDVSHWFTRMVTSDVGAAEQQFRRERVTFVSPGAVATDPYSSSRIQPGTRQSCPSVCEYQTKKTERTLSVQIITGRVDPDCRNGTSQNRYHGYMTGAPASDAAIGHAHASGENGASLPRNHTAVTRPNKTDTPAACGRTTRSIAEKTGSSKRNRCG
jgi:hypothetical protein